VWALQKLEKSAVFVFADYAQIEFGGVPRGKQKVWKPKGAPGAEYAREENPVMFSFMLWAIIALDEVRWWVSDGESAEEKAHIARLLGKENKEAVEHTQRKRRRALMEGTEESKILQETNANIDAHNARLDRKAAEVGQPRPRKGKKQQLRPERLWKAELKKRGEGSGIDWVRHREKALIPHAYPLLRKLRVMFPGQQIVYVEDNASNHTTAARHCELDGLEIGFMRAPHPPT
jgi:hypothetical protein